MENTLENQAKEYLTQTPILSVRIFGQKRRLLFRNDNDWLNGSRKKKIAPVQTKIFAAELHSPCPPSARSAHGKSSSSPSVLLCRAIGQHVMHKNGIRIMSRPRIPFPRFKGSVDVPEQVVGRHPGPSLKFEKLYFRFYFINLWHNP